MAGSPSSVQAGMASNSAALSQRKVTQPIATAASSICGPRGVIAESPTLKTCKSRKTTPISSPVTTTSGNTSTAPQLATASQSQLRQRAKHQKSADSSVGCSPKHTLEAM